MINHKIEATAILNTLEKSRRVMVVAHKKPDGDALGSACAWWHALTKKGLEVDIFCLDKVPDAYRHLPGTEFATNDVSIFQDDYDVIIVNDSGDLEYAGIDTLMATRDNSNTTVINVDHHSTNPLYGDINLIIPTAGSTTEIITRLLNHWEEEITQPMAENLLNGILSDTDSLMNPATSYHSLVIASQLVKSGADIHGLVQRIFYRRPFSYLKMWGLALSRLQHNKEHGFIATYITLEDIKKHNVDDQFNQGLINYLTVIPDINAVLSVTQIDEHHIKGSFRSISDSVDVGQLALKIGGGGHQKASGFKIRGQIKIHNNGWTIA